MTLKTKCDCTHPRQFIRERIAHHTHRGGRTLSGLFEPAVTAMLIVRYCGRGRERQGPGSGDCTAGRMRILAGHFFANLGIQHRGPNTPELPRAEKPMAARVTAVGGKSEPALEQYHGPSLDALAGNMLQVEIAAAWTMRVALKRCGHAPTVKSAIAGVASPGTQPDHAGNEIEYAVAVRSKAIHTAALRTNHRHPAYPGRRIPKTNC